MVIKDLLNKVSSPEEKNDPKVAALREKLAALQQSKQPAQQPAPAQTPVPPKKEAPKLDKDVQSLATASLEEQKKFAQQEDPMLMLKEERTQKLLTKQVSELIEVNTELQKRLKQLEQEKQKTAQEIEKTQKKNLEIEEKMKIIDQRLEKFMGLYEIITNQYNPFHEEQKDLPVPQQPIPSQPPAKVKLADGLTGAEEEVEFSPGSMSSENAQKMQQLLAELEAAEKEKQKALEPTVVEKKEEAIAEQSTEQLHELLGGFEERLKQYLDLSLQEKLHATFAGLEEVLNQEIQEAVKGEVSKLKEHEDIISSALQEIESLQSTDEAFETAKQEVVSEVQKTDDLIKTIPPNLYFRLADGRVLKSKQDLVVALREMPQEAFDAHVTKEFNHFADWLTLALEDSAGEELRNKSRDEMISLLEDK